MAPLSGFLAGDPQTAFNDFLTLSANFDLPQNVYSKGDVDLNGAVDFTDFLELSANFGLTPAAAAASPMARRVVSSVRHARSIWTTAARASDWMRCSTCHATGGVHAAAPVSASSVAIQIGGSGASVLAATAPAVAAVVVPATFKKSRRFTVAFVVLLTFFAITFVLLCFGTL